MADVVMADEAADVVLDSPAPPAPPPKMVVDPMTEVKVDEASVTTDSIAEVVMAELVAPAPAPPASVPVVEVSVTVPDGEVTRVVAVAPALPELPAALLAAAPPQY